ncbi:taste receptor type 1 member 2-like [Xenopus laevis]|uniref:Taste receptor type 1 member 2-like n=1 Tax=Xenopus laevis TaxID=8355 RepID=A0A8J1MFY4_XENLA|nr:taste receptor type 1 member 2-like [Xenopus laevis]
MKHGQYERLVTCNCLEVCVCVRQVAAITLLRQQYNMHTNPFLLLFCCDLSLLIISAVSAAVSAVVEEKLNPQCSLKNYFKSDHLYQAGDILLGGIMQMSFDRKRFEPDNIPMVNAFRSKFNFDNAAEFYYHHYLALKFTIDEINQRTDILPNITLGYMVCNTWALEGRSMRSVMSILSGGRELVPNYECEPRGVLAGFIGDLTSESSYIMSHLTGLYHYPQVLYCKEFLHILAMFYVSFLTNLQQSLRYYSGAPH